MTCTRFNQQGLSLAVGDTDGGLWVWQVLRPDVVSDSVKVRATVMPLLHTPVACRRRFLRLGCRVPRVLAQCHGKRASDVAYLNSRSLVATVGVASAAP